MTAKKSEKKNKRKKKDYRRAVGIVLMNDAGLVFIAQRDDTRTHAWQMPQGGADKGEKLKVAALRELAEETGVRDVSVVARTKGWLYYDFPEEVEDKMGYRGQRQKWFLMRFLGKDDDIDLNATDSPEFSDWRWASKEEAVREIVWFKKDVYRRIMEEFKDFLA